MDGGCGSEGSNVLLADLESFEAGKDFDVLAGSSDETQTSAESIATLGTRIVTVTQSIPDT